MWRGRGIEKTLDRTNASWSGKPVGAIAWGELPHEDEGPPGPSDDEDGDDDDDLLIL